MLTCPQCKKEWPQPHRQCPTCLSDLSLLADFLAGVQDGLSRAETHITSGELGQAVREYLAVLEVDPENATARRRMAEWARAVRHFDRPPRKRRRRRRPKPPPPPAAPEPAPQIVAPTCPLPPPSPGRTPISVRLVVVLIWGVLALVFGMGFLAGTLWGSRTAPPTVPVTVPD